MSEVVDDRSGPLSLESLSALHASSTALRIPELQRLEERFRQDGT
jgi:hypothetical protein